MSQQQQLEKLEMPNCPYCNSNANIKLNGWTETHDRRQYYCKPCKHRFVYPRKPPREKGLPRAPRGLSIARKEAIAQMLSNRTDYLLTLDVDSIANVPCFACEIRTCDPSTCDFMGLWLNGITTITKVCRWCKSPFTSRLNSNEFCCSDHAILYNQKQIEINRSYGSYPAFATKTKASRDEEIERLEDEGEGFEMESLHDRRKREKEND